jgi:hypothetical protein
LFCRRAEFFLPGSGQITEQLTLNFALLQGDRGRSKVGASRKQLLLRGYNGGCGGYLRRGAARAGPGQGQIEQTLHDSTDTRTDSKGLPCTFKRATLRVIDALLDEVLCDLRCGFLRTLNAAFGPSAHNAVYNAADRIPTQHPKKTDGN